MRLFVYGTLKRGQVRNRFLAGQTFLGVARTQPHYRLYDLGDYPGLVCSNDGLSIEGELWDVDDACLAVLDREEGCDTGLYRRDAIALTAPHADLSVVTYFYARPVTNHRDCGTSW